MNLTERMKALSELAECVQGVIRAGWMDRVDLDELSDTWHSGEYRVRWHDDGTASILAQDGHTPLLRFRVEVTVSAVVAEPAKNEPQSHLHQPREWRLIPAGWFVQVPSGQWWEVVATEEAGAFQEVTLRRPDGQKSGTWKRTAGQKVTCCPGIAMGPVGDAIAALGANVIIISDQVD